MCNFEKKIVTNKCYNGVYEYFECKRLQNVEFTQYLLQNVVFMIAEKHDNGVGELCIHTFYTGSMVFSQKVCIYRNKSSQYQLYV